MCFHSTINTLYSVIQAIILLLSKLKVVMYIPTTLFKFSFILHVESMAKTVIKGTISQLSLGNSSSQTIANPFHSLQVYWHLPFCVNTYYISCTSAYTTCWRDGELKLQLMMGQLQIRWFNINTLVPALPICVHFIFTPPSHKIIVFLKIINQWCSKPH